MSTRGGLIALIMFAVLNSGMSASPGAAADLKAECAETEATSCLVSMVLAYYANRSYGIEMAVEETTSPERSVLLVAANQLSVAAVRPEIYQQLETGEGRFSSNPLQAERAARKLRALFGFEDYSGARITIAVSEDMDFALAYNLTAAFWGNSSAILREVAELSPETVEDPFLGVTMTAHPGARHYFETRGVASLQ